MKRLLKNKLLIGFILLLVTNIFSQQANIKKLEIMPNEHWWGGVVWDGHIMPLKVGYNVNLYGNNKGNQAQPLLISDMGRIIWSEDPISYSINEDKILVTSLGSEIKVSSSGSTLKEAFLYASQNYFPASGKYPDDLLFKRPQYNTWIELIYNQNQVDILKYAKGIVENGFDPGVIMIDDNWQEDYGKWDFHQGRFSNPKQMIQTLHELGFKVMLWICPFVSPDSDVYRDLEKKGFFIKTEKGDFPLMVRWWNGTSAVLDFTNPEAVKWFDGQLKNLQDKYGVDGYKLDAGDSYFYDIPSISYDTMATPNDQTYAFQQFGLKYPLNEYRATWKMGGQPLAQRLHDKGHNWEDLSKLVPQIMLQGLLGYPFNCPDMIGGGEYGSFIDLKTIDQELIVRSAQVHALMPMMQFSVAPWRVLSEQNLEAVKKAVTIRKKYLPIIMQLVKTAAKTGEPVVRTMEYEFPHQGYYNIKDQFMLGSNVLVAPILEKGMTKRLVTLPKGRWKTPSGKILKGGKTYSFIVKLDELLFFERKQ
jgi:alpha-glucosidase